MPRRVVPYRPTFHSGKPVLLTRAPTFRAITATCFFEVPTCSSSLQGWQKNRKLFAKTRELSFGSAQLFPRIAPLLSGTRHFFPHCSTSLVEWHDFFAASYDFFCCIARFLLLHHSISFAFPRLTLRSPSNAQVHLSHRSPTTSTSLCLPSVNSLSTTTAAP